METLHKHVFFILKKKNASLPRSCLSFSGNGVREERKVVPHLNWILAMLSSSLEATISGVSWYLSDRKTTSLIPGQRGEGCLHPAGGTKERFLVSF